MKKHLIRFFLAFSILLLTLHGQLGVYLHNGIIPNGVLTITETSVHPGLNTLHNTNDHTSLSAKHRKSKVNTTTDTEGEEDRLRPFKKITDACNYFTKFFYAEIPGYFCLCCKNILRSSKDIFHFSSHRWYIIFSVFRI